MKDIFFKSLLENLYDGVYFVDRQRSITYWNKSAEKITGYSSEEVMGKSCADNILRHVDEDGNELCIGGCPLEGTMTDGKNREAEVFLHHKDGHRVAIFVRGAPIYGNNNDIVGAVEVFSDNMKYITALETIRHLQDEVLQDTLTRIGNRRFAELNLNANLKAMDEHSIQFGVLMIDIDFFKKVNDTYGHGMGDRVLQMTAKTMANGLRPLDIPCRWGGEEFIVIIPNTDLKAVERISERLRMLVEKSWIDHGNVQIRVTVSVGATLSIKGDTGKSIVDRADGALYESKKNGRNRYTVFFHE